MIYPYGSDDVDSYVNSEYEHIFISMGIGGAIFGGMVIGAIAAEADLGNLSQYAAKVGYVAGTCIMVGGVVAAALLERYLIKKEIFKNTEEAKEKGKLENQLTNSEIQQSLEDSLD